MFIVVDEKDSKDHSCLFHFDLLTVPQTSIPHKTLGFAQAVLLPETPAPLPLSPRPSLLFS